MSDNLDKLGNFGIQDTMEMGAGDTQLLNDLFAPETASGNPEDVTPIVKEVGAPQEEVNDGPRKGKDITTPKSVDGKTDEEKQSGESLIADFLSYMDDDDDDDEPEEVKKSPVATTDEAEKSEEETEEEDGTQFSALANDLFNLGVFTKNSEDEEVSINTPEEFLERFTAEKKKGAS